MASTSHPAPALLRLAGHPLRWRLLSELSGGDLRVRELVAQVGEPQSLVSYHLRLLRDAGLVTSRRSSLDGRDSYHHLDLDRCAQALAEVGPALHPSLGNPSLGPTPAPTVPAPDAPATVLFVCTGNSARSPVAEALVRHHAAGRVRAASAGTRPRAAMHPGAVRALRDRTGIDISGQRPRPLDAVAGTRFDHLVTLCDRAREELPAVGVTTGRRSHWRSPHPAPRGDDSGFAALVADLDTRVRHLLPTLAHHD
jgi:protein-tyrosine-phosphatase/DNA-binding transcriptional ArsR family regulator